MAKQGYQALGLKNLIISGFEHEDPEIAKNAASNASEMLTSTMISLGEVLCIASDNENWSIDMHDVMNIAWLIKELSGVHREVLGVISGAEYVLRNHPETAAAG
jgi:hypothetical protein